MCRVCCRFQLKDSQGLGMGGLAAEWLLCLLPMLLSIRIYSFTNSGIILLAKFVNQTTRVLHICILFSPCISKLVSLTTSIRWLVMRHTGCPAGGFPFACWRGMIMESDHALAQHMFRNNHPNCHWEVSGAATSTSCSLRDSAALSIPISPSPKSHQ